MIADDATGAGETTTDGSAGGEGVVSGGGGAPGNGRGRGLPLEAQVDGVLKDILGGCPEPGTRNAMLSLAKGSAEDADPAKGSARLKELLSIAFASPEFQRR